MQRKTWKNYLFEGTLIVFSVMLALFFNQVVENIETSRQKDIAIDRISAELERNLSTIERWLNIHTDIKRRIDQIISGENNEIKEQLLNQPSFSIQILTGGQSFIDSNLSSTAWETVRTTDIINEFDFETVEMLTSAYTLQSLIFDQTIWDISNLMFNRETQNLNNLDDTLLLFQLHFNELVGQERLLAEFYPEVIRSLE